MVKEKLEQIRKAKDLSTVGEEGQKRARLYHDIELVHGFYVEGTTQAFGSSECDAIDYRNPLYGLGRDGDYFSTARVKPHAALFAKRFYNEEWKCENGSR